MTEEERGYRFSHWLFLLSLTAKGLIGVVQLATAAAIIFHAADELPALAHRIFAAELAEDPNDFLAARIIALAGMVPKSQLSFYALYFSAHGILHVGVVAALLVGHAWAYPGAIAVLAAFICYQLIEWAHVGGPMLLILSAIDLFVIFLTLREWKHARLHPS